MKGFVASFFPSKPVIEVLDVKRRMCAAQELIFQVLSERA